MPSFDIVNELDLQEVDNAVNMADKEISTRYDFRGGKSKIEYARGEKNLRLLADDDMKMRALHQVLETKMAKRGIDLRCLDYGKEQDATGNMIRQDVALRDGIGREDAKRITKLIKETKLKVQAQIQDTQVRVTGKKIDDLQDVIAFLKENEKQLPLQFVNMRS